MCNNKDDVKLFAPAVRCDSACVTVLEPQYFGGKQKKLNRKSILLLLKIKYFIYIFILGILNERQPYTYIRGCATDVFAWTASRPAEVDFMHKGDICLSLPISEIWPDVMANDLVTVCSCTTNGCNVHDTINFNATYRISLSSLIMLFFIFMLI